LLDAPARESSPSLGSVEDLPTSTAAWRGVLDVDSKPLAIQDRRVVSEINRLTGAGLTAVGRAAEGRLGGAIYAQWPDGRRAVVTRFLGSPAEARRTAEVLAYVRERGLPVPRHDLVVELHDGVVFVQERLPSAPPGRLTVARVDAMVEINDRFAGALTNRVDVPIPPLFQDGADQSAYHDVLKRHSPRGRRVLREILRAGNRPSGGVTGADLVHVDLSAANVLFDTEDRATAVVDWNLGAYRGDRLLALVKTRFDREWFVRSPNADPVETAAAIHLDTILTDRIAPDTLRMYWAHWMLYQLHLAIRSDSSEAIAWHLDLTESRLV
jgi:hypothetical protein